MMSFSEQQTRSYDVITCCVETLTQIHIVYVSNVNHTEDPDMNLNISHQILVET